MTEYEGVERSKTEQLRKLLDDRGVKWKALSDRQEGDYTITATRWHDSEGSLITMCISEPDGGTWDFFWYPTPEQAVEATVGHRMCKNDSIKHDGVFACSACGVYLDIVNMESVQKDMDIDDLSYEPRYCPSCGRKVAK